MNDIHIAQDKDIETLFKVQEPLEKLKNGNGYLGVVLRDHKRDLIQCHECGLWFKALLAHVVRHHRQESRAYRIKYQLPLSFPLVSRGLSKIKSDNAFLQNNIEKCKTRARRASGLSVKTQVSKHYPRNNRSFENKLGLCPEQIYRRFLIVKEQVGAEPSNRDIEQYDPSLMGALRVRYGNVNNFREQRGFVVRLKPALLDHDMIIASLRKFAFEHKRNPRIRDFRKKGISPSDHTIRSKFGSFRRALKAAGLGEVGERFKPAVLKTASLKGDVSSNLTLSER